MSEFIDIKLKRAAIILADELSYPVAAKKLNVSCVELRMQIALLETQLYIHIFKPKQWKVELTKNGEFLIKTFRECVALHDLNGEDAPDNIQ